MREGGGSIPAVGSTITGVQGELLSVRHGELAMVSTWGGSSGGFRDQYGGALAPVLPSHSGTYVNPDSRLTSFSIHISIILCPTFPEVSLVSKLARHPRYKPLRFTLVCQVSVARKSPTFSCDCARPTLCACCTLRLPMRRYPPPATRPNLEECSAGFSRSVSTEWILLVVQWERD